MLERSEASQGGVDSGIFTFLHLGQYLFVNSIIISALTNNILLNSQSSGLASKINATLKFDYRVKAIALVLPL
jgi:hypothetical protein